MGHLVWLSIAFWLLREVRTLKQSHAALVAPETA
jgi:hypothetical protein